ncbi:TTAGGG repeat binding factor [Spiromyces aspiralis]|uniref:TTAGGG repeat binding factor n=1 Tax=Spiromyces aspiralis TaxID=68401 RepID=A0ACC1HBW0_9FUNG|nr:TTAGGG repeat binding factor [Spiromyces aspiralis]
MWTLKEEQCLVEALNEVGGPQWSRILELHGPKGIKSNILAERDTIGLKDKARNIKQSLWADGKDLGVFWYVTGHLPANKRPRGAPLTEKEELSRKRKRANSGSS